jgi:RNA polymerase sigma factor (sigma-70 family)
VKIKRVCIQSIQNGYFPLVNNDKHAHITDQQLLERFHADHNNEWLGILLQRYTLLLLGVCMKYLKNEDDAKDSVQQVFLKVIQELHKYKVEYFKSWLYMVAKNHCLMKIRDRQGKIAAELTEKHTASPLEETDREVLLQNDHTLQLMEEGLKELNKEQQQCVTLFYLQKKSYQEIAEETGYSMLQVKSYIQNGKRNLKIWIEKKLSEEAKG